MTKKYPCLHQRGNKWIVRKRVPNELKSIIGKREITKSLKTSDIVKAKLDYFNVMAEIEKQISEARSKLSHNKEIDLSELQAERLAKEWYQKQYGNVEEQTYCLVDDVEIEIVKDDLDYFQALYSNGPDEEMLPALQSTADNLLVENNYPYIIKDDDFADQVSVCVDKTSKGYQLLLKLIRRGHINALKKQRDILDQERSNDPFFSDLNRSSTSSNRTKNLVQSISLAVLIDKYIIAMDYDLEDRNYKDFLATFRIFKEHLGGNIVVDDISYDHLQSFLMLLKRLPPNFRKLKYRYSMTLDEIANDAEKIGEVLYSVGSINKHMARIKALMKWGNAVGYVAKDYSASKTLSVKPNKNQNAKDGRLPFSIKELNQLFIQKEFTNPTFEKRSFYWLPLIALFHGLRMEEILQLKFEDIKKEENIHFFDIHDDGDNSLKNANAKRSVPVHNYMWELGFNSLLLQAQKTESGRLFSDVNMGKRDRYSAVFTQRFSRYLEKIDIKKAKLSFHSFRHNFRDAAKNCNIGHDRTDEIGGWSYEKGAKANYGSGINLIELNKAMQKIKYEGVNFKSISTYSTQS